MFLGKVMKGCKTEQTLNSIRDALIKAQHLFFVSYPSQETTIRHMVQFVFSQADRDGSGDLSLEEFKVQPQGKPLNKFQEWALSEPLIRRLLGFKKKQKETIFELLKGTTWIWHELTVYQIKFRRRIQERVSKQPKQKSCV